VNSIELSHVTKEFRLGQNLSLRRTVANMLRRLANGKGPEPNSFRALDDVTFCVTPGEVLGIIGHNGAGKSTLLKVISNICRPTSGSVRVRGRIAPLIEVGAGFVPDFTGRENIFLNGTILGMSRREITRKFDEIVAFSELERFIDTPVKRYSSGMQVKLAFSVATSVESEILIVDEVLAVGDVAFQRKCINRMEKLIHDQNRTVLIVGHNIRQLERICSRILLLDSGRIIADGLPGDVTKKFLDETTGTSIHGSSTAVGELVPGSYTGEVDITSVEVTSVEGAAPLAGLTTFADLNIKLALDVHSTLRKLDVTVGLHTPDMVFLVKTNTSMAGRELNLEPGRSTLEVRLPCLGLVPGTYGLGPSLNDWTRKAIWAGDKLRWLTFEAPSNLRSRLPPSTLSYTNAEWNLERTPPDQQ